MSKKNKKKGISEPLPASDTSLEKIELEVENAPEEESVISSNAVENAEGQKDSEEKIELFVDDDGETEYRQSRYAKKKKLILTSAIIILALIFCAICTFVALKLFGTKDYDKTDEFYFTSDYLTEKGGMFAQSDKISFELYNYADDLRTSIYDVEGYEITVSVGDEKITDKCKISESKTKLNKNKREKANITIELPKEYYRQNVDVKVTSKPNPILLKGTFNINPAWSYELTSAENSIAATLTISSDKAGEYTVKWDTDKVTADSTNRFVALSDKDGECSVALDDGEGCEIVFFKKDLKAEYSGFGDDLPVSVTEQNGGEDK